MPSIRMRDPIPKHEDDFEILCLKLLRCRWKCPQLEQYGKRGDRQDGIDLLDLSGDEPLRAAQCKRHEEHKYIPPAEIQKVVDDAKNFKFKIGLLAIMTTAKVSTHSDLKITEINREHTSKGLFAVELLNWERIQRLLDEFPEVRDDFYGGASAQQLTNLDDRLTDIHVAVKSIATDVGANIYDATLEEAKTELERHEYQLAKLLLQRLRRKDWDQLNPRQRFRLVTNLGFTALQEGDVYKAAAYFFEAKTYQPEDEKALVNEILGNYVVGELQKTFELATALRPRFPNSTLLTALWIHSNSPATKLCDLIAEIPKHLLVDAEVATALALRALQQSDFTYAETLLRDVKSGRKDWSSIPGLHAKAILGAELHTSVIAVRDPAQRRSRLLEAKELANRAIELAKKEKQNASVVDYLLCRAQMFSMLGDSPNSTLDVDEAYHLAPSDPTAAAAAAELHRSTGSTERAIEILRQTVQTSPRLDIRYQLAASLHRRGRAGDFREAAELLTAIGSDPTLPRGVRIGVADLAVDCLFRDGRAAEAKSFAEQFPSDYFTPLSDHSLQAQLKIRQGDLANAVREAQAALAAVTEESEAPELEYLAKLLNELGLHKEALPLWQMLIRPGQMGPDPKRLLDTAVRLKRHDVIIETCQKFREEGVDNADLFEYEVAVLEQYDVPAAIQLLVKQLEKYPSDKVARLRLSLIGLKVRKNDLVCADPNQVPAVHEVTASGGMAAVQVLKFGGSPDAALHYAYELLRLHFNDPIAHRTYQSVLLPIGPQPSISEADVAGPDTAVSYLEDGTGEPRTVVIENPPPHGQGFNDEITPAAHLAGAVDGKRVGDRFALAPPGNFGSRSAVVTKILNKFVYRYQDSMSQFQIRFPQDQSIEVLQIINDCSEVVIDLTAIATLCLLGAEDTLRNLQNSLVVSQSTLAELRDTVAEQESRPSKGGLFTKVGDNYTLIEETEETKTARLKTLRAVVGLLESVARILPCRQLAAMDTEKRDILYKAFGRHGAETIILAAAPGRLLWTDDQILAQFAAKEHGVRRIWTQVTLQHWTETGKIAAQAYFDASAKLLAMEYSFTSSNSGVLLAAGHLSDWDLNSHLLLTALNQFSAPYVDLLNLLRLAALFGVDLYKEPLDLDRRDRIFTSVLDKLATKPGASAGISAMRHGIERLFGVNVIGARQIQGCIDRWLNPPQLQANS